MKVKKIKNKEPKISFLDTDHRKYIGLEFDFKEGERNITKKIISKIEENDVEDAVVQIQIKMWDTDLQFLDLEKINKRLTKAHYVRPIVPLINRVQTMQISDITADLTAEEAVKKFIKKISPENADRIQEKALAIIRGCED